MIVPGNESTGTVLAALTGKRFLRFIVVGALAAAVNIGARAVFSLSMPFGYAVVAAFPFGLTVGYLLSRIFVFDASGDRASAEYLRFLVVNLLALVQVWVVSLGLAKWLFPLIGLTTHAELLGHTIGVLSPVFTSYYAHKLYTFRQSPRSNTA